MNMMRWNKMSTRRDEQFDILHARNGATDAEIQHDEHDMKITADLGLSRF